jgi:alkyl sulfatase BDS1-like metallo-beta-lactamase superfamily hydrolase
MAEPRGLESLTPRLQSGGTSRAGPRLRLSNRAHARLKTAMGGIDQVVDLAETSFDSGGTTAGPAPCWTTPYSWTKIMPRLARFTRTRSKSSPTAPRTAPWRSFFLSGATELREGNFGTPAVAAAPAIVAQLNRAQLLDSLATSVNGLGTLDLALDVTFTDIDSNYRLTLRNGVLIYVERPAEEAAGATLTLTKARMIGLVGGDTSSPASTSSET